jgi:hypothetical protein
MLQTVAQSYNAMVAVASANATATAFTPPASHFPPLVIRLHLQDADQEKH